MRIDRAPVARRACAFVLSMLCFAPAHLFAAEDAKVSGSMTANGKSVQLPYAYAWAEEKGFYDEADPTWTLLFSENPVAARDLKSPFYEGAWLRLGVTRTAEFGDKPELQVYSQSIKFSADAHGNVSGGNYPAIELTSTGPERFAGRVYHAEKQKIFDDTFQYDFQFDLPLTDLNAPIGEPLPAGGGAPGKAYLKWVAAIQAVDLAGLKELVPAEMAETLSGDDAREQIAAMRELTPTDVTVLSGSSDGETAVLQIEGTVAGERTKGEITLTRMGEFWVPTGSSW